MFEPNMIGAYGPWAASLAGDGPGRLSFRNPRVDARPDSTSGGRGPRNRVADLMHRPPSGGVPEAELQHQLDYDGLHVEHLHWQLPYGPPTEAVFLKPTGATGRLPGRARPARPRRQQVLRQRKIAQIDRRAAPDDGEHREDYYGGVSWANELAKRGFAVLSTTPSPSPADASASATCPRSSGDDLRWKSIPRIREEIKAYNEFAAEHEHLMAKSLFCAGTTWPGVLLGEDRGHSTTSAPGPDVDPEPRRLRRALRRRTADGLPRRHSTTGSPAAASSA